MLEIMNYTIPSDNRELQQYTPDEIKAGNYTIPSDNRELQPVKKYELLKSIIPYQVITGNYNESGWYWERIEIIPYQVITGNYNRRGKKED